MSSRWPGKYVIGLTGNIAVGKSLVRQRLQELGAYAIDADRIAHQVMMPGGPAFQAILAAFGPQILGGDGQVDRAALGRIVFSDLAALKRLEAITHPVIHETIDRLVKHSEKEVAVIEAIKLLEGRLKDAVDAVWVVHAAPQTQHQRLISQRGLSPEEARQRIQAQNSQADKIRQADVVIHNDGDIADTLKQVQAHWPPILSLSE